MLGPCNEHTDVNALDCIQRLYKHCRSVSTLLFIHSTELHYIPALKPYLSMSGPFTSRGGGDSLFPEEMLALE